MMRFAGKLSNLWVMFLVVGWIGYTTVNFTRMTVLKYQYSWEVHQEMLFPQRSPSKIRKNLHDLKAQIIAPYMEQLEMYRKQTLKKISLNKNEKWTYPKDKNKPTQVLLGHQTGWFQKLDNLPSTTGVVYLNAELNDLSNYMDLHMYNWSASNCSRVIEKSITEATFSEKNYGTSCYNQPLYAWQPHRVTPMNMMRALPSDYVHPEGKVTLTHIHVIMDAVVNKNGDVFVDNSKIVGHRCPYRYTKDKYSPKYPESSEQASIPIYDEVFTMSQYWGSAYFHILVESLPRLVPFADFILEHPSIKIHIFGLNHSYLNVIFSHFEIPKSRFIFGLIRARVLYLPQSGPCAGALVFNGRMQSMVHRSKITVPPQPRRSIVLIKRSKKRFFRNHNSIVKALEKVVKEYGDYDVEVFSDNPLPTQAETMAMFNRAFMVVAPHGGGESNLHFSEPGTILVEGLCHPPNLCYRNHMHSLGHRYFGIYLEERNCFTLSDEDIAIPVEIYLNVIQQLYNRRKGIL